MRLKDKVAIVTGAASGIGRATSILFAREGARVAVVDRDEEKAKETLQMIADQGSGIVIPTDISKSSQVKEMVKKVVQAFEKIDILVNNAGIVLEGDILKITEENWDKTMEVNLRGAFLCCKYVIPEMLARNQDGGSVINIASDAGILPEKNQCAYNASKSGLIGLTRAIAVDLSSRNIRSNCVCPGAIETAMMTAFLNTKENPAEARRQREAIRPIGRIGRPEEVAYGILYLASDESAYTTGAVLSIDGGRTSQ
jgi:NAD(P)-dependent dehydrogenase (short-subunit alcohol dehydrogenase family)